MANPAQTILTTPKNSSARVAINYLLLPSFVLPLPFYPRHEQLQKLSSTKTTASMITATKSVVPPTWKKGTLVIRVMPSEKNGPVSSITATTECISVTGSPGKNIFLCVRVLNFIINVSQRRLWDVRRYHWVLRRYKEGKSCVAGKDFDICLAFV